MKPPLRGRANVAPIAASQAQISSSSTSMHLNCGGEAQSSGLDTAAARRWLASPSP